MPNENMEGTVAIRCWKDTANSVMESFINLQQKVAAKNLPKYEATVTFQNSHIYSIFSQQILKAQAGCNSFTALV